MADIRSSLKVLFQGETNLITCGSSNTYEEVISQGESRNLNGRVKYSGVVFQANLKFNSTTKFACLCFKNTEKY